MLATTDQLRTTRGYLYVADPRPNQQFRGSFGLAENPHTILAEVAFRHSAIQGYRHAQSSCSRMLQFGSEAYHNKEFILELLF